MYRAGASSQISAQTAAATVMMTVPILAMRVSPWLWASGTVRVKSLQDHLRELNLYSRTEETGDQA